MKKQVSLLYKKTLEGDSQLLALVITFVLWLVALAIVFFVPLDFPKEESEPVYQGISLVLAPVSPASSQSLSPAASKSPTQELARTPSEESAPAASKSPTQELARTPSEESAPAASKSPTQELARTPSEESTPAAAPVASVPVQEPVPTVTDPAATGFFPTAPETTAESTEPVDVDSLDEAEWEVLFAQGGSKSYSTTNKKTVSEQKVSSGSASLSGSAATTSPSSNSAATGTTSSSTSQNPGTGEQFLSQDTESALGRIDTAASGERNSSPASGIAASGSGGMGAGTLSATAMPLVGGGVRQLLYPSEPVITISERNQSLVPGSVEVSIVLDISPQGLVLPNSIKITPESLVHPLVQSEIKEQIGKWRFQAAEGSGQVHFKYNIMKK